LLLKATTRSPTSKGLDSCVWCARAPAGHGHGPCCGGVLPTTHVRSTHSGQRLKRWPDGRTLSPLRLRKRCRTFTRCPERMIDGRCARLSSLRADLFPDLLRTRPLFSVDDVETPVRSTRLGRSSDRSGRTVPPARGLCSAGIRATCLVVPLLLLCASNGTLCSDVALAPLPNLIHFRFS
jgi:hypothetical protein